MLGEQRSQAGWRVLAFIYAIILSSTVTPVITIIGVIWMVIDVLWQALSNKNTLSEDSRPAMIVGGVLRWNVEMLIFAISGGGPKKLEWTPLSRI